MADKKDLRGGIEKMREVAQLLNGWASDLERSLEKKKPAEATAVDAAPAEDAAVRAEPAAPAAAPVEPVPPKAEDVRALLAAKCAAGFRAQVQALINSFGAAKFSEVDPSHYAALLEAAAALAEGGDPDAG